MLIAPRSPLWQCAFRPLFTLTTASALALMLGWIGFLALGWPLPPVAGGVFVWHVHELLLGFAWAAIAGFTLTAVPEFTHTADVRRVTVLELTLLWLVGRIAFWSSGIGGAVAIAIAALAHLAFLGVLAVAIAPRIWGDAERRHASFLWALAGLGACAAGFYWAALTDAPDAMRWLRALLGLIQILIIVALSRISMRIVNAEIDALAIHMPPDQPAPPAYMARPPRRNMAVLCIGLFTLAQWAQPSWPVLVPVGGWLALAASAAVLALMGDWHVGRALLRRWPLCLYAVYAAMSTGYALIGLALLSGRFSTGAGTHLLTIGAMSLAIYMVMVIAGYTHCGIDKSDHAWPVYGAVCLLLAAAFRVIAYFLGSAGWMCATAALWCAAFALVAWNMIPLWWSPRGDGKTGCAE